MGPVGGVVWAGRGMFGCIGRGGGSGVLASGLCGERTFPGKQTGAGWGVLGAPLWPGDAGTIVGMRWPVCCGCPTLCGPAFWGDKDTLCKAWPWFWWCWMPCTFWRCNTPIPSTLALRMAANRSRDCPLSVGPMFFCICPLIICLWSPGAWRSCCFMAAAGNCLTPYSNVGK